VSEEVAGVALTREDIEAQLRVLEQNQREQESSLLKMYGARIALQQLLALLDVREGKVTPPPED
jgi:hypothetical protein